MLPAGLSRQGLRICVDAGAVSIDGNRFRIRGMDDQAASDFIFRMKEHCVQPQFVYAHKWQVGDLVIWDNRTTMHRARPYDDTRYPRDLRRTTLTDGVPTVAEQALAA